MENKSKNGTVISSCVCEHEFQDKNYGKGMRVKNRVREVGNKARCTVCDRVSNVKD